MLEKAVKKHNIHLTELIAETAIWANPKVHKMLCSDNESGAWFLNVRRGKKGEKKGSIIDGIRIDDNTYANNAIKRAIGVSRDSISGFETCHIWPNTCYNNCYHTTIANLILLPRAIASLTDFDTQIENCLKYRSYELYVWCPEGEKKPNKPEHYPNNWREPEEFNSKIEHSLSLRRKKHYE